MSQKIFVTSVIDPSYFFAFIGTAEERKCFLEKETRWGDEVATYGPLPAEDIELQQWVMVLSEEWERIVRARVVRVITEKEGIKVDVRCEDYQTCEIVPVDRVYPYSSDPEALQHDLEKNMVWCRTAFVKPICTSWTTRATDVFKAYVWKEELDVEVCEDEDGRKSVEIMITDEGEYKSTSQLLLDEGLALNCTALELESAGAGCAGEEGFDGFERKDLEKQEQTEAAATRAKSPDIELEEVKKAFGLSCESWEAEASPDESLVEKNLGNNIKLELEQMKMKEERFGSPLRRGRGTPEDHRSPVGRIRGRGRSKFTTNLSPGLEMKQSTEDSAAHGDERPSVRERSGASGTNGDARTAQGRRGKPREPHRGSKSNHGEVVISPRKSGKKSGRQAAKKHESRKNFNLEQKIRQVLMAMKDEKDLDFLQGRMKSLVYPRKGHNELDTYLYVVLETCIEHYERFSSYVCELCSWFADDEFFVEQLTDVLDVLEQAVIDNLIFSRPSQRKMLPKDAKPFGMLLGQIIVAFRGSLRLSEIIRQCTLDIVKKWCIDYERPDALEVTGQALEALFQTAKGDLLDLDCCRMHKISQGIRKIVLDKTHSREVRSRFLDILIMCSAPKNLPRASVATQAKPEQTDADVQVTVDDFSCSSPSDPDPYSRVREMLCRLQLSDIQHVFISNAVRDVTLTLEWSELKELLKECGLKPGQIYEIKNYLAPKKESTDLRASSSSSVCSSSNNSQLSQTTTPRVGVTEARPTTPGLGVMEQGASPEQRVDALDGKPMVLIPPDCFAS